MSDQRPRMSDSTGPLPMRGKLVLRGAVRLLVPFVLLFGFYVQLHGDYGPGGGFQAGVIFATGIILFGLIFGSELAEEVLPPVWTERLLAVGVLLFAGVGIYAMTVSSGSGTFNFLDYDALGADGGQHYGIVLVELAVGIAVAAAMVRLFYAFADLAVLPEPVEEAYDETSPLRERLALERAVERDRQGSWRSRSSFGADDEEEEEDPAEESP